MSFLATAPPVICAPIVITWALLLATVCSLAQLVSGDLQAKNVAKHQPAKMAAMEGLFETTDNAPLYLWGWPDATARTVHYGVALPGMLSWLIHHDAAATVTGLNDLEADFGSPPVWLTFQAYHAMIAIGMVMIAWLAAHGHVAPGTSAGTFWSDLRFPDVIRLGI